MWLYKSFPKSILCSISRPLQGKLFKKIRVIPRYARPALCCVPGSTPGPPEASATLGCYVLSSSIGSVEFPPMLFAYEYTCTGITPLQIQQSKVVSPLFPNWIFYSYRFLQAQRSRDQNRALRSDPPIWKDITLSYASKILHLPCLPLGSRNLYKRSFTNGTGLSDTIHVGGRARMPRGKNS